MSKFGTSLLVPSVQELAKKPIIQVPEQYVYPNQDPIVLSNTTSLQQVPVIDLSKLLCENATEFEKLDQACKEWGFFQVLTNTLPFSIITFTELLNKIDRRKIQSCITVSNDRH